MAAGTAHGFALFDFVVKKNLLAKSTLGPLGKKETGHFDLHLELCALLQIWASFYSYLCFLDVDAQGTSY